MAYLGRAILHEMTGFTTELALNVTATTDGTGVGAVTNVVTILVAV